MKSIVVLQARTGSSRLPAKVLLPLAGMPLLVLAAKRAGNTGRKVMVATSTDQQDDELVATIARFEIPYFRGSLHDTLARMVEAVDGFEANTIFVRLTGDNVLPDGYLIDQMLMDFENRRLDYLCCNGDKSGLPYGVSVEVTRVGHLRKANLEATAIFDREHVTPYLARQFGYTWFEYYKNSGRGHLRCTVDILDDYLEMCRIFRGIEDPVSMNFSDLVDRLVGGMYQPIEKNLATRLIVGTAQFGMLYGVTNLIGSPTEQVASTILKTAISNGVGFIDTARAYGSSEQIIGRALEGGWLSRIRIITKLSPLASIPVNASVDLINASVDASLFESCMQLKVQSIDTVLLHRTSHLTAWDGMVLQRIQHHLSSGLIQRFGVSVQTPDELMSALEFADVSLIQMPFNIVDNRWDEAIRRIERVKKQRPLQIHVRSVLLQGLLSTSNPDIWKKAHISDPATIIGWLNKCCEAFDCMGIVDLSLRFVRSMPWVDGVIIGMESLDQLHSNIHYFNLPLLGPDQIREIISLRPNLSNESLNPNAWIQ